MKKILFALTTITFGGVEKELLTVLKKLPKGEFDVTVCVLYSSDERMNEKFTALGARLINLGIDPSWYCQGPIATAKSRCKRGKFFEAFKVLFRHGFGLEYCGSIISNKDIPALEEEYDLAICYHIHAPITVRYVVEKVRASKKYAWMHNDFTTTGYNPRRIEKYLRAYDRIVGCSQQVSEEFVRYLPTYKDKTMTAINIVDDEEIIALSKEEIEDARFVRDGFTILTIGRFVIEKGYEDAVAACKLLIDAGYPVKWYAIGWGVLEEEIAELAIKNGVGERFILLGKKENPYPYLRACDLYVQPSRSEGFGLVLSEAKALKKPIVTTDFAGAREQLIHRVNATIVEARNPKAIAEGIAELIQDEALREAYVDHLEGTDTSADYQKILALLRE